MTKLPMKQCNICGRSKPGTEFYRRTKSRDGLQRTCKDCQNDATNRARRQRYKADEDSKRRDIARNTARKYGLTLDQYYTALEDQMKCAICEGTYRMAFDHDHATGKFRKRLCNSCNTGLGMFQDDPELLRIAAKYIEEHK